MQKEKILDFIIIAAGAFALSWGINGFLVPLRISTGGVSGIATILYYLFSIPLFASTLAINLVLFFVGFRCLKPLVMLKNLAGILLISLFLKWTEPLAFQENDMLLSAVFGGVLSGIGVGLTLSREGTTGGVDFLAMILKIKFPHMGLATLVLLMDSAIILASGILFRDFTVMLYSVISVYICSKVADFILVRGDFAKSVTIISQKNEQIAKGIMQEMERGVTGIFCKHCYRNEEGMMLMCVVRNREVPHLLERVKMMDSKAFTIISEVREVRGEGFKSV